MHGVEYTKHDKINKGIQHEPQVGVLKIELCALRPEDNMLGGTGGSSFEKGTGCRRAAKARGCLNIWTPSHGGQSISFHVWLV